jgi:hypothetical protein
MLIKLTSNLINNQLLCPEDKRRIEYVDTGGTGLYSECRAIPTPIPMSMPMPIPVAEPGPVPMLCRAPVRHGGACRCDDKAKKILLDFTEPKTALMAQGEECEAKDLFERECWDSLSHAQQIEVGQCIVCLVAQGLLPLENLGASPKSANHVIYRKL